MNKEEKESFDKLRNILTDIIEQNKKFREYSMGLIEDLSAKVNQKHLPIVLEQDILQIVQQSISKVIGESLIKYDSPLHKLISKVIDEHSVELKTLISDSFSKVIRTEEFKNSIVSAFSHKVAKTIISNNDGLFEKVSNELKQDSIFKAKMSIAVSSVVEECLNERKNKTQK